MKISMLELWNEFKSSKKKLSLAFAVCTICCLIYSAYCIPQIYMARIEIELPAKIDINSANMIATILRGGTFMEQENEDLEIMHSVTLVPSGDIINVDFSGADYAKVDAFKEKFVEQGLLKSRAYVAEAYGKNKANQIEIILDEKNYNRRTNPVKTINIYAAVLLGIVTTFCVLVVEVVLKRKHV